MGIPHVALVMYILYIISKKIRILQNLKRKCRCLLSIVCRKKHSLNEDNSGCNADSLPDRLMNPDEYDPLIPVVSQQGTENIQSEACVAYARVTPMNTYGIGW